MLPTKSLNMSGCKGTDSLTAELNRSFGVKQNSLIAPEDGQVQIHYETALVSVQIRACTFVITKVFQNL